MTGDTGCLRESAVESGPAACGLRAAKRATVVAARTEKVTALAAKFRARTYGRAMDLCSRGWMGSHQR
jgi:hypothetical protein